MSKQTISERITQRMHALNLKGKDLVNATGASKGSVSQWMNGGGAPSSRYISSLAKILKVNENWLLNGGELNTGDSLDLSLPPIKRFRYYHFSRQQAGVII